MTDETERTIVKFTPAFGNGFLAGRLGLPGSLTLETAWGPVEGVRDGNSVRWTLPDHQWLEARYLVDGTVELYQNDRLVGRHGPVEIEPDDVEE